MSGDFLPMQLIYKGKTSRCHPKINFPEGFNITQSENLWSNEEKCKELIRAVLIPYVKQKRNEMQLRKNQEWLLIADVFKGHWTEGVKKIVNESHGKMVPVPNNMTDKFHPLDLTVSRSCKAHLRRKTHEWFSGQVQKIQNGIAPEKVKVDLKMSTLKPLHRNWVISFYDFIQNNPDIIQISGIVDFLNKPPNEKNEDPFL